MCFDVSYFWEQVDTNTEAIGVLDADVTQLRTDVRGIRDMLETETTELDNKITTLRSDLTTALAAVDANAQRGIEEVTYKYLKLFSYRSHCVKL